MHRVAAVVCVLWVFFVSGGLTWHYLRPLHQTSGSNEESSDVALVNVNSSAEPIEQFNEQTANDEEILPLSIEGYRAWKLVNEEPYEARLEMTILCRATPDQYAREQFAMNPHLGGLNGPDDAMERYRETGWRALLKVYVNDLAAKPMLDLDSTTFPEGSIIVKEKWKNMSDENPILMTVMRKRESGYNSDCGDWEFASFDGNGEIVSQGRLENCMRCHIHKPETDYVFGSYVPGAVRPSQVVYPPRDYDK